MFEDVSLSSSLEHIQEQLSDGYPKKPRWLSICNFEDEQEQKKKVEFALSCIDKFDYHQEIW